MAEPAYSFPAVWTETDLESLPEDGHRHEILDGSLILTPPASYEHQHIGSNLLRHLFRWLDSEKWEIQYELGIRAAGANLVPDIVILRRGTAQPGLWQESENVGLVVEIASKSTQAIDDKIKKRRYAQANIPSYWQIKSGGMITAHSEPKDGCYQQSEVAKPGVVWDVAEPFALSFDPAILTDLAFCPREGRRRTRRQVI